MLGYPRGLQIWDCANLGSVSELLNLAGSQWGAVGFAGVLPDPPPSADDAFKPKRPLIGFSYVLSSHKVKGVCADDSGLQVAHCAWHGLSCILVTHARSRPAAHTNLIHVLCCI